MLRNWLAAMSVAAGLMGSGVWAQEAAPMVAPADAVEAAKPVIDDASKAAIDRLAASFLSLKNASVTVTADMKVEVPGRPPQQMTRTQSVTLARPNLIKVVAEDPQAVLIGSDGKQLTIYVPQLKKYVQQEAPATFDAASVDPALMAFIPLGNFVTKLFSSSPSTQFLADMSEVKYVGKDSIDGVETEHLRIVELGDTIDLWITTGEQPVIRRFSPDLTAQLAERPETAGGKASMVVDFTDWKLNADLPADAFAVAIPEGVTKSESIRAMFARESGPHPLIGQPAPAFELSTLDGQKVSLESYKGKNVVVLDFWATWCGPCVVSLPVISQIAKDAADQGVVFYAVNEREDAEAIKPFLKEHNLDINVLLDADGAVGELYQANAIPQTVIIGKDGVVKVVEVGFDPDGKEEFKRKLLDAAAGK